MSGCCLAGLLFLAACKDELTPAPAPGPVAAAGPLPNASFTQNRLIIERFETVTFTSFSTNATRLEWDFGTGQGATEANPTAIFPYPGSYRVKLKAFNADGEIDTASAVVQVKRQHYIKEVRFLKVNFLDPNGNPWDADGSGPDVRLHFQPGPWAAFRTTVFPDVAPGSFPLSWVYPGSGNIPLGNQAGDEIWTFRLEEAENFAQGDKVMATWTLNPSQGGTKNYFNGTGFLTLTDSQGANQVEVHFELY